MYLFYIHTHFCCSVQGCIHPCQDLKNELTGRPVTCIHTCYRTFIHTSSLYTHTIHTHAWTHTAHSTWHALIHTHKCLLFISTETASNQELLFSVGQSLLKLQEIVNEQYLNYPFNKVPSTPNTLSCKYTGRYCVCECVSRSYVCGCVSLCYVCNSTFYVYECISNVGQQVLCM